MAISLNVVEPGTIGTYTDLVAKVADWLNRDDLTAQIPDFIALLESELRDKLRTSYQETLAIWTITSSPYALPADFLRLRRCYPAGTPTQRLTEVAPDSLQDFKTGATRVYAIEGRQISLAPAPTAEAPLSLEVNYLKRIPPLSAEQPDNWLLNRRPDIYVWGVLHYASAYIRDPEAMTACRQYLDAAIDALQTASRMDSWGGPLVPRGIGQVRGARC